jgi:DNA-binding transcriptional ArsR family regulator
MNLEDLPALLKRMEDSDARNKALETAMLEQGATMAEILSLLRDQGPATAKAIADALKGVKLTLPPMPAPAPAPVATPAKDWTSLTVTTKQPFGPDRVQTITKQ